MNYQEAFDYITQLEKACGSDYSLDDVTELARRSGIQWERLRLVHVAGTNGKGSVSNDMAYMLAASGYTVGRYVSPAVFDYRERVQRCFWQNGQYEAQYISKEETAQLLSSLRDLCDDMTENGFGQPTAFEIETVMAFLAFERWKVDIAIVETGMGGRLDATNIMPHPIQCVFSSISLDHRQVLGDTLPAIAAQKYGIIKEGAQVVSLRQETLAGQLCEACREKNAELHMVDCKSIRAETAQNGASVFSYRGERYPIAQRGLYQLENAAVAVEAVRCLRDRGFSQITGESMKNGLSKCVWRGRFDLVSKEPFVLADGAHNPDAAKRLREALEAVFPGERFCFVIGVFRDKEYKKILEELLCVAAEIRTVTAPGSRGLDAETLCDTAQELVKKKGYRVPVVCCETIPTALQSTQKQEKSQEPAKMVVCGSLSILRELYAYLNR